MLRSMFLLTIFSFLTGCVALPEQQGASSPTPAGDEAALRALALRLLAPRYPGAPAPEEVQLLVGQLPDKLPVGLPLPAGARVIGSLARGQKSIEVVLDTDQPPDQVLAFYREHLTATGWSALEPPGPVGGFVPATSATGITFCQGSRGPSLWIAAHTVKDGPTDVRLNLRTDPRQSPCAQPRGPVGPQSPIPRLVAPPETWPSSGGSGSGGGGDSFYANATLETDLDSSALAAHYAAQLEQGGWRRRDGGQAGPLAWSTWTLQDEEGQKWQGLFFALEVPDVPDRRFVYVRVDLAP